MRWTIHELGVLQLQDAWTCRRFEQVFHMEQISSDCYKSFQFYLSRKENSKEQSTVDNWRHSIIKKLSPKIVSGHFSTRQFIPYKMELNLIPRAKYGAEIRCWMRTDNSNSVVDCSLHLRNWIWENVRSSCTPRTKLFVCTWNMHIRYVFTSPQNQQKPSCNNVTIWLALAKR